MKAALPDLPQSTPVPRPSVFALPREERVRRGFELARRDPLTALRVAVIEHGRIPGSGKKHWGLMWWGSKPRRFLPDGRQAGSQRRGVAEDADDHSKIGVELAEWYHAHVDELPENWGPRLITTVGLVALDRYQFPRFSMQSWRLFAQKVPMEMSSQPGWLAETPQQHERYLQDVRYYRDHLLKTAVKIEAYAARLTALDADSNGIPTVNPLTVAAAEVGAMAAENQLGHARALRTMAGFLAIHGRAGSNAKGAARGIFVRVLNFALGPRVPQGLRARFIATLLEDLNFGSRKNIFRDSSTLKNTQAILRAAGERAE